jgi:hypothetical protein
VLLVATFPLTFVAFTVIFGAASWTVLTRKPSARNWGIAASLVHVLAGIFHLYWWHHKVPVQLAVGIAGLIAFLRRDEPVTISVNDESSSS